MSPGEVTQAPLSLGAVLSTFNFPSKKSFLSFNGPILVLISDFQRPLKLLSVVFLILKFSSASPLSFFAHGKGLGHISFKKGLVVPQRLRDTFGALAISDVLNYPKTGSLAKNHFWLVATQKKRCVLII